MEKIDALTFDKMHQAAKRAAFAECPNWYTQLAGSQSVDLPAALRYMKNPDGSKSDFGYRASLPPARFWPNGEIPAAALAGDGKKRRICGPVVVSPERASAFRHNGRVFARIARVKRALETYRGKQSENLKFSGRAINLIARLEKSMMATPDGFDMDMAQTRALLARDKAILARVERIGRTVRYGVHSAAKIEQAEGMIATLRAKLWHGSPCTTPAPVMVAAQAKPAAEPVKPRRAKPAVKSPAQPAPATVTIKPVAYIPPPPVYPSQVRENLENRAKEEIIAMDKTAAAIDRAIPDGSTTIAGPGSLAVYVYERGYKNRKGVPGTTYYAKAFADGEQKHAWHRSFKTEAERADAVAEFLVSGGAESVKVEG